MSTIQSPDYFSINGVLSSAVNLYCDTPPIPPMAKKRFTTFRFGSDEDGVFSDDSFENVSYSLTAFTFEDVYNISDIYAFFQNAQTLEISRDDTYYYKIRTIDGVTPQIKHDGARADFRIRMTLAPFRYHKENAEIVVPQSGVITNPGTRYSKPIFKCTVSASGSKLTCNGSELQINDTGAITIDSARMLIYKTVSGVNTAITQKTVGQLPMLSVGTNAITWTEGISNLSCVGNWRDY